MLRFAMLTLGCKVNQYDSAAIGEALTLAGGEDSSASNPKCPAKSTPPNLVVINTCCVTAAAMRKSRYAIRRALHRWREAFVLVVGCYSDFDREKLLHLLASEGRSPDHYRIAGHHVDLAKVIQEVVEQVEGVPRRPSFAAVLRPADEHGGKQRPPWHPSLRQRRLDALARRSPGAGKLPAIGHFAGHTRAFVKIQDGCDAFCAYCVVPYTRPRVWSRTLDDVLAECRRLVAAGHKEIVLSGVFLGAFGRNTAIRRRWGDHPALLPELLRQMGQIEGLWRVRLSSLEPLDADRALLDACTAMGNFAPHFHLPLQSGSDRVLRRMNRQYTAVQFRQAVDRIRQRFDRPAFTTDIIVGFPGESDEDFAQTLDVARFSGFSKIHAFPFSAIEGTSAHLYKDEAPPPPVVRKRLAALAAVESELALAYRGQFVGQTVEGLVEMAAPGRRRQAITDRHLIVEFDGQATARTVVRIQVAAITPNGLEGRLV